MKTATIYILGGMFALAMAGSSAFASVISVKEFNDRYEVSIDGSMDPHSTAKQVQARAETSSGAMEVSAAGTKTGSQAAEVAPVKEEKAEQAGSQPSATVTAGAAQEGSGEVASAKPAPYNRGAQMMAYLAQLPKRSDYVEGRLEARQLRWSKLVERASAHTAVTR